MSRGLPEPQPGYRWELQLPDSAPRKRHPGRWLAGIVVLLVLIVGGALVGEWLARDVTTKTIRGTVVTQLGLPKDQDVDVELQGSVLLQLITGSLDDVTVSSQDVALGPLTGDITLHATDVPVRGEGTASSGTATIGIDEAKLRALMGTVEGFPADTLGLAAPDVTMTYPLSLLGVQFPVGVALQPSAADAELVLTPSSFQLGDAKISADDLRDRFGKVAQSALGSWNVCIAQYIPAGMALTSAAVQGDRLVATFDVDGGIVSDPTLQAKGTCG